MHGMLSVAILVIVFVLVAAVGGGSTVWLYRAASNPGGRSRSPRETTPTSMVTDTQGDDRRPVPEIETVERPEIETAERPEIESAERSVLALPAPPEPSGPGDPPAAEPDEGARVYVLDSSRRPSR